MNRSLLTVGLFLLSNICHSALVENSWTYLSDDDPGSPFVGQFAGADLLWGTGDEAAAPGQNAAGYASSFIGAGGALTGYFGGTSQSILDDVAQSFSYTAFDFATTTNCAVCQPAFFNLPGTGSLSIGNGAVNAGQLSGFDFTSELDVITDAGDVFRIQSTGVVLPRGFAPADVTVDPNLIAHFQTILPSLPDNWSVLAVTLDTWEVIAGPNTGTTGTQSQSLYLSAVPIPPAVALFAVPLLAMTRRRRQG